MVTTTKCQRCKRPFRQFGERQGGREGRGKREGGREGRLTKANYKDLDRDIAFSLCISVGMYMFIDCHQ